MTDIAEAADAAAAGPGNAPEHDAELRSLHTAARLIAVALTVAIVVAFVAGYGILERPEGLTKMVGVGLIGFAGSGVGALVSLLNRYAAGFELDDGARSPPGAEGEVFQRRIAFCFVMRPVLGLLIAPLIVAGVSLFLSRHETFTNSVDAMTLASFIGGLYAKLILEAAKNAFKVVFRT